MALVEIRREQQVVTLTLNDPDRLNAMGEDMALEFRGAVERLRQEPPRVIILTGAGRAFSAGGDLDMLEAKSRLAFEENRRRMLEFYGSFLGVLELGVPVVAAINGHAVGAGFCLAAACDLRVADESAKFAAPFARLGLHPGMGATHFLPRLLGPGLASDLLLTGRRVDAAEALQIGLVSRLGPALERAQEAAAELLSGGPTAVAHLLGQLRGDPDALLRALENEAREQAHSYASKEFLEGLRAARERRSPDFSLLSPG